MASARTEMIEGLRRYGIRDEAILVAMGRVPRHRFVPASIQGLSYADRPLPIGLDQTISQPYIVARMTELVRPRTGARALDVGTGSGYQAAVLAELGLEVYSIEILCDLADGARERLTSLGYAVEVRCGDGWAGWPDRAPFDRIIVAAAPPEIPPALVAQLAPGGRMALPVGPDGGPQELVVVEKRQDGTTRQFTDGSVIFVPMTGEAQR